MEVLDGCEWKSWDDYRQSDCAVNREQKAVGCVLCAVGGEQWAVSNQ
jgi:hypothetical protein